jgi:hypothetical protein
MTSVSLLGVCLPRNGPRPDERLQNIESLYILEDYLLPSQLRYMCANFEHVDTLFVEYRARSWFHGVSFPFPLWPNTQSLTSDRRSQGHRGVMHH